MTFQIVSIADNSPGAQLSNIVPEYKNRQNVCNGDNSVFKQAFMTGLPDPAYLHAVRARCNHTGTLLIFDEIQTGFGRTGSFWAFQGIDPSGRAVVPDVLVGAKGMGGGMPIGAFMAPEAVMAVIKNNPMLGHITTFGGHPVDRKSVV